eukprot:10897508-Alexandrium_andersonii.AAC.1
MSASLVGSEMCIRDSLWTAKPDKLRRDRTSCGGVWRVFEGAAEPLRAAVSYTHLTLPTICSV